MIETWCFKGKPIKDIKALFNLIDKNHSGTISFDEFCDWAITKGLDLEDDDDQEDLNDWEKRATQKGKKEVKKEQN